MKIALIMLAGGRGIRMGGKTPKVFLPILGTPLITYSLRAFTPLEEISQIVLVCPKPYRKLFSEIEFFADPGERRQDSVANGLKRVDSDTDFVLIHDGARPLIQQGDIRRLISVGINESAAALGSPLRNTLKKSSTDQKVLCTPPREDLWEVYTPQIVRFDLLQEAYKKFSHLTVTDDLSLIEHLGHKPSLVSSTYPNIKATYPEDMLAIQRLL